MSEPLNEDLNKFIMSTFKKINLLKVLENNSWIAGGFARMIANHHFNIQEENFKELIEKYLFQDRGDIDIFSISPENINKCSVLLTDYNDLKNNGINVIEPEYFNVFSKNFQFYQDDCFDFSKAIKVQLVNKFFYQNIKSCFESFDFVNCKFALSLEKGKLIINYTNDSLDAEKRKVLVLQNSSSPLLAKRIIKYIKKGLKFDNVNVNKNILKDFYYKVLTKSWNDIYKQNMDESNFNLEELGIDRLAENVDITNEDLILFIGKLTLPDFVKTYNGYGYNYHIVGQKDWATSLIKENASR